MYSAVAIGLAAVAIPAWAQASPSATPAPSARTSAAASHAAGHGANTSGPYDATTTGGSPGNGVGSGKAVGEPCAGCVGNADDKNPPGQLPNGSDPNAGYECDRNQGIGQQNPAHTGCTLTASSGDSATASSSDAPSTPSSAAAPVPSENADEPSTDAPASLGVGAVSATRAPDTAKRPSGLSLTGAPLGMTAVAALALLCAGTWLAFLGRRRYHAAHRA